MIVDGKVVFGPLYDEPAGYYSGNDPYLDTLRFKRESTTRFIERLDESGATAAYRYAAQVAGTLGTD